jgi:2-methylisocitrate lyase-like PEP mutase family enzyme
VGRVSSRYELFRALHEPGSALVLPNPWDAGSARILASLGFAALATTSAGYALTRGRPDGAITREDALAHARQVVASTELPVSADLENGFGDEPTGVAETVVRAADVGLAGCSIEDYTGRPGEPIYDGEHAAARIEAASSAATGRLVLTARAENLLHGRDDLADTIARLQRYQQAGADVLYAPGLVRVDDITAVLSAIDRPLNVLLLPSGPSIEELFALGVTRVSLGSSLAYAAYGALVDAARQLLALAPTSFWTQAATGRQAAETAVRTSP